MGHILNIPMGPTNCSLQWEGRSGNGSARSHRNCHRSGKTRHVITSPVEHEGGSGSLLWKLGADYRGCVFGGDDS